MTIKKLTTAQLKAVTGGSRVTVLGKPSTNVAQCLFSFFKKC
jgi:hypothetical protein